MPPSINPVQQIGVLRTMSFGDDCIQHLMILAERDLTRLEQRLWKIAADGSNIDLQAAGTNQEATVSSPASPQRPIPDEISTIVEVRSQGIHDPTASFTLTYSDVSPTEEPVESYSIYLTQPTVYYVPPSSCASQVDPIRSKTGSYETPQTSSTLKYFSEIESILRDEEASTVWEDGLMKTERVGDFGLLKEHLSDRSAVGVSDYKHGSTQLGVHSVVTRAAESLLPILLRKDPEALQVWYNDFVFKPLCVNYGANEADRKCLPHPNILASLYINWILPGTVLQPLQACVARYHAETAMVAVYGGELTWKMLQLKISDEGQQSDAPSAYDESHDLISVPSTLFGVRNAFQINKPPIPATQSTGEEESADEKEAFNGEQAPHDAEISAKPEDVNTQAEEAVPSQTNDQIASSPLATNDMALQENQQDQSEDDAATNVVESHVATADSPAMTSPSTPKASGVVAELKELASRAIQDLCDEGELSTKRIALLLLKLTTLAAANSYQTAVIGTVLTAIKQQRATHTSNATRKKRRVEGSTTWDEEIEMDSLGDASTVNKNKTRATADEEREGSTVDGLPPIFSREMQDRIRPYLQLNSPTANSAVSNPFQISIASSLVPTTSVMTADVGLANKTTSKSVGGRHQAGSNIGAVVKTETTISIPVVGAEQRQREGHPSPYVLHVIFHCATIVSMVCKGGDNKSPTGNWENFVFASGSTSLQDQQQQLQSAKKLVEVCYDALTGGTSSTQLPLSDKAENLLRAVANETNSTSDNEKPMWAKLPFHVTANVYLTLSFCEFGQWGTTYLPRSTIEHQQVGNNVFDPAHQFLSPLRADVLHSECASQSVCWSVAAVPRRCGHQCDDYDGDSTMSDLCVFVEQILFQSMELVAFDESSIGTINRSAGLTCSVPLLPQNQPKGPVLPLNQPATSLSCFTPESIVAQLKTVFNNRIIRAAGRVSVSETTIVGGHVTATASSTKTSTTAVVSSSNALEAITSPSTAQAPTAEAGLSLQQKQFASNLKADLLEPNVIKSLLVHKPTTSAASSASSASQQQPMWSHPQVLSLLPPQTNDSSVKSQVLSGDPGFALRPAAKFGPAQKAATASLSNIYSNLNQQPPTDEATIVSTQAAVSYDTSNMPRPSSILSESSTINALLTMLLAPKCPTSLHDSAHFLSILKALSTRCPGLFGDLLWADVGLYEYYTQTGSDKLADGQTHRRQVWLQSFSDGQPTVVTTLPSDPTSVAFSLLSEKTSHYPQEWTPTAPKPRQAIFLYTPPKSKHFRNTTQSAGNSNSTSNSNECSQIAIIVTYHGSHLLPVLPPPTSQGTAAGGKPIETAAPPPTPNGAAAAATSAFSHSTPLVLPITVTLCSTEHYYGKISPTNPNLKPKQVRATCHPMPLPKSISEALVAALLAPDTGVTNEEGVAETTIEPIPNSNAMIDAPVSLTAGANTAVIVQEITSTETQKIMCDQVSTVSQKIKKVVASEVQQGPVVPPAATPICSNNNDVATAPAAAPASKSSTLASWMPAALSSYSFGTSYTTSTAEARRSNSSSPPPQPTTAMPVLTNEASSATLAPIVASTSQPSNSQTTAATNSGMWQTLWGYVGTQGTSTTTATQSAVTAVEASKQEGKFTIETATAPASASTTTKVVQVQASSAVTQNSFLGTGHGGGIPNLANPYAAAERSKSAAQRLATVMADAMASEGQSVPSSKLSSRRPSTSTNSLEGHEKQQQQQPQHISRGPHNKRIHQHLAVLAAPISPEELSECIVSAVESKMDEMQAACRVAAKMM